MISAASVRSRQRGAVDGVVVVLARDLDLAGVETAHRVVPAVVAERELVGACPDRLGEQLVAQADPEHRHPAQQIGHDRGQLGQRGGIAGPVGEKDAVGLERQPCPRAGVAAGTTVTVASSLRLRSMVSFTPKS